MTWLFSLPLALLLSVTNSITFLLAMIEVRERLRSRVLADTPLVRHVFQAILIQGGKREMTEILSKPIAPRHDEEIATRANVAWLRLSAIKGTSEE